MVGKDLWSQLDSDSSKWRETVSVYEAGFACWQEVQQGELQAKGFMRLQVAACEALFFNSSWYEASSSTKTSCEMSLMTRVRAANSFSLVMIQIRQGGLDCKRLRNHAAV